MTIATRLALAGASLLALGACAPPDPVAVNGAGDEANLTMANVIANDNDSVGGANSSAPAPAATTRSEPISKPGQKSASRPASKAPPPRPEPLPSPTSPPAEVDPVRDVDITDPG